MVKGNNNNKQSRKTRLDKSARRTSPSSGGRGTSDFIGFGAFAASNADAAAADNSTTSTTNSTPTTTTAITTTWSPVYTGKHEQFAVLFPRLYQKRDAVTVTKCLHQLDELYSQDNNNIPKPVLVEALQHYAWLYHSKLALDAASSVRAAAAAVWVTAHRRIPKAVRNIIAGESSSEILGMLYATRTDPAAEVRAVNNLSELLLQLQDDNDWPSWQTGLLTYTPQNLELWTGQCHARGSLWYKATTWQ